MNYRDVNSEGARGYKNRDFPDSGNRGVLVPLEVALARQSPHHKPRTPLGVRRRWDPSKKRWRFRAIVKRHGIQHASAWTDDPYEAAKAYIETAEEIDNAARTNELGRQGDPWPNATLDQALSAAIAQARARGVGEGTIKAQWRSEGKLLIRYFGRDTRLREIDVHAVIRFVRAARADGRTDTSIRTKDLFHLDHAFRAAGLPSPVQAAKKVVTNLRDGKKAPDVLTLEEAKSIIARVRASDPDEYPAAQRDADILEITLYTGIRAGEWSRIRREDIDTKRCLIHVRLAKNRARPRSLPVPERLRPALDRLKASADTATGRIIGGGMGTTGTICAKWKDRLNEPRFQGLRSLRRCVASALADISVPLVDISLMLGHTSTSTTDRYIHSLQEGKRLRKAIEDLDG